MIELKNILLPTDFSEPSLASARYALELARRFGSRVHLLYVIEDPQVFLPPFEHQAIPSRDELEAFARDALDAWELPEGAEGCDIVRRFRHGTPFTQIINDARENDIDLIVLGTHGRGAMAHLLMGSVAEKVVRKAPCPVLTVRPEGHQFIHPAAEALSPSDSP
ncbi:MAG: universal stress protein [Planctomycetes bacterium]|nr:universal stress protein [Planctomycetota bacterium]